MKKLNFLKSVLSVAFATLAIGAFGQIPGDYAAYDPADAAPNDSIYITVGNTMGYYVTPDPVYHPNYNALGAWALTDDFTWDWTVVSDPGTAPTITPGALDLSHYATILYPVIGRYVITVAETAPAAFGGCAGNDQTLNVQVIPAPTGTMSINPGVAWQALTANQVYQICANQLAQVVTVAFHENVPADLASYAFQVTEQKELIDGTGTVIAAATDAQAETVIQDFGLATKFSSLTEGAAISGNFTEVSEHNFTLTFNSDALAVLTTDGTQLGRTRYTYRVRRTTNGATVSANNDFISAIAHKSDYLEGAGNEDYFAFANNTVSFIVNPAPVTGPIFHVPNDFRY
jgi:hypothetical protein